jgi:hypothetical protein
VQVKLEKVSKGMTDKNKIFKKIKQGKNFSKTYSKLSINKVLS